MASFEHECYVGVILSCATSCDGATARNYGFNPARFTVHRCKIQYPVGASLLTGALPVAPSPWLTPEVWSAGPASRGIFQSADTVMTNPPAARGSHRHTLSEPFHLVPTAMCV